MSSREQYVIEVDQTKKVTSVHNDEENNSGYFEGSVPQESTGVSLTTENFDSSVSRDSARHLDVTGDCCDNLSDDTSGGSHDPEANHCKRGSRPQAPRDTFLSVCGVICPLCKDCYSSMREQDPIRL